MTLYEIIKSLQTTQGTKAKQAVLDDNKDNELLKAYLKAVYDPAISYYITKLPTPEKQQSERGVVISDVLLEELDNMLAKRTLTGNMAKKWVAYVLSNMHPDQQELFGYIIKRSIDAKGIGETMVLKTFPGLFFVPPYMRCKGMDDKAKALYAAMTYFFVESKMDGSFAYLVRFLDGKAALHTRAGTYYPTWLAEKIASGVQANSVLMGELVVYLEGKLQNRKDGNGILNSLLAGDADSPEPEAIDVQMVAWDLITVEEFIRGESYSDLENRFTNLLHLYEYQAPNVRIVQHFNVTSLKEAFKINTEHTTRGEEGTVWKNPKGIWRDSSSGTYDAVKVKVEFEADYEIIGAYEGKGKAAGMLGGFNYQTKEGQIESNVGTGLSDKQRIEFWKILQEEGMDAFNGCIATIKANDVITREGTKLESLFLPVFIEMRGDKTEADTYERVIEQLNNARSVEV